MDIGSLGVYAVLFLALYFEVFLLISFFEKLPSLKTAGGLKRYPTVSIIIPCFNEERTLAATVNSVLRLEYPREKLYVIIVDDGSRDGTAAIAARFAKKDSRIRAFSKENGGKWTALNFGIERSTADIVGCLDADSFAAPDALTEVVKLFEQSPATIAVVPAMKVHAPRTMLELMQAVEYTFGIFYKKMFDNLAAISVLPGPFSFYRRGIFSTVGLFRHAHNTEDMEMAFRLHAHGLSIENAHTAFVYTKVPSTLRSLIKQRTRWSQGFLENSKDYAYMYFNPRFGYFGLLVLPFGLAMFLGSLYIFAFALWKLGSFSLARMSDFLAAQVPPHAPSLAFNWIYFPTSMLLFLALATAGMTLIAILIGRRISGAELGFGSLLSYFMLYGFVAPLWLARAAWGTVVSKPAAWR